MRRFKRPGNVRCPASDLWTGAARHLPATSGQAITPIFKEAFVMKRTARRLYLIALSAHDVFVWRYL